MLVLSRQRDETIMLDFTGMKPADIAELCKKPIEVQVVDIRGDKVRIGTTAPQFVAVHRFEVWEDIQREKRTRAPEVPPCDVPDVSRMEAEGAPPVDGEPA
jgi:carbon storage regulator